MAATDYIVQTIAGVLSGGVGSGGVLWKHRSTTKTLQSLQKQVTELTATVSAINSRLEKLEGQVDSLQDRLRMVKDRTRGFEALQKASVAMNSDMLVLQNQVSQTVKGLEELNDGFKEFMKEEVNRWQSMSVQATEMAGMMTVVRETLQTLRRASSGMMPKSGG